MCIYIYIYINITIDVSTTVVINSTMKPRSLEWLQQQNLLYGTELADAEDVRQPLRPMYVCIYIYIYDTYRMLTLHTITFHYTIHTTRYDNDNV